jgi:cobalt-zinc-cadmium efflux system protein
MAAEVTAAAISHSLALLSDAAHMLTDAGAIGLSLVALRLAARPAQGAMTFGLKRAEILSAQLNGATLAVLGLWIVYETIHRLISAPTVDGQLVLIVALSGAAVNLARRGRCHAPTARTSRSRAASTMYSPTSTRSPRPLSPPG